ncbi:MAG: cAMP-activated global transcriptional regulator CRP [Haliea sp.]|nr:cAMP-activated global transcriptional regulator CRP [Haliea sp.]MBK6736386.1 cAMP-activated global transcriptional regulator CRP [Haliea sp.]
MLKPQIIKSLPNVENFLRHCQRKDFRAKSVVLKQGEQSNSLCLILDGSVSVMVEDESEPGHMLVVAYLNPGDFVGEMGLFDNDSPVRSAMVVAKTQCEVAEITYERFHQIRNQFPDILYAVSRQLGARLRQTTRKLSDLAFVDVSGRIAHTLLDLCREPDAMTHPDGMQIKITRQELGKIVGCSREMAGRVLKSLEQDGLVSVSGKTMVVYGTR